MHKVLRTLIIMNGTLIIKQRNTGSYDVSISDYRNKKKSELVIMPGAGVLISDRPHHPSTDNYRISSNTL